LRRTAAGVDLSNRPISPHPYLAMQSRAEGGEPGMAAARAAYDAAQQIEDLNERRSAVAAA
jgi:hypothetical protein